jgi:hypothetical protein
MRNLDHIIQEIEHHIHEWEWEFHDSLVNQLTWAIERRKECETPEEIKFMDMVIAQAEKSLSKY